MKRMQQFQFEVNEITKKSIRQNMPEAKKLAVEICWNLSEIIFTSSWSSHFVFSGLQKKFIAELGMIKCNKSEAHIMLVIGERPEWIEGNASGIWKKGVKNIYLKPGQVNQF